MEHLKTILKTGKILEYSDDTNQIDLSFNKKNEKFILVKNGVVVKSTKQFKRIFDLIKDKTLIKD